MMFVARETEVRIQTKGPSNPGISGPGQGLAAPQLGALIGSIYGGLDEGYESATEDEDEEHLVMPANFSMVDKGIYRSSFPRGKNIGFLRSLGLKSVISLVPEDYPHNLLEFYESNGIKFISHGFDGNKGPFKAIEDHLFIEVIRDVLNPLNRPLLIHCNKGKHRTGCVVGCYRRSQGWSLASTLHEYILFSYPKSRLEDQRYIESFDPALISVDCDST
jgi:tyrosine-protein phosphatase SIW14